MQLMLNLTSEQEQLLLGQRLSQIFTAGLVFLTGNLGTGKTTLSRGWIQALGHTGAVKSPTYTLVEEYSHLTPQVYHFDLYRLADPEELELLGMRDFLQPEHLCLIEWPEKGAGFLPQPDLLLELTALSQGREIILTSPNQTANTQINQLAQLYS